MKRLAEILHKILRTIQCGTSTLETSSRSKVCITQSGNSESMPVASVNDKHCKTVGRDRRGSADDVESKTLLSRSRTEGRPG